MQILVIALVAALLLLLLPRFLGRKQDRMLSQYEVLEKRFGFERRVAHSKWGKGIGEHHSLAGNYRGYPASLYGHFHETEDGRVDWTSLVFETLFAGELEMRIEFSGTQENSRFSTLEAGTELLRESGVRIVASEAAVSEYFSTDVVKEKLERFGKKETCGSISLSKGFLEYRETGAMEDEPMRLRFQDALLLLADLADAVSVFARQRKGEERKR